MMWLYRVKKYTQGVNDFINGYDFTPSGIFVSLSFIIYYIILYGVICFFLVSTFVKRIYKKELYKD